MLQRRLRKSSTTADVFYPCRQTNLPLIIALRLSLFQCVCLKSPSKCGRQCLPGASALLLPSCAHCVCFAGWFCVFVFVLCQASIKFPASHCSASLSAWISIICLLWHFFDFFFSLLFLPSLWINIEPQRKIDFSPAQRGPKTLLKKEVIKQTNKLIRWNKGKENVLQRAFISQTSTILISGNIYWFCFT